MDIGSNGGNLLDLIAARTRWLAQRHGVLSGNVANADTPGFVPLDVASFDPAKVVAGRGAAGLALERTVSVHLAGSGEVTARPEATRRATGWEVSPSGNAVVLEEQAQKLAATQLDYQLASNLYGKYLGMMRTAMGVGKG
jgi:flagellar basal-body rod protein FlgB